MRQRITVRAIIKKEDELLFLRRSKGSPMFLGKYELPGGIVEFGEDLETCLKRELMEEIGQRVIATRLFDAVSYVDQKQPDVQHIIILYEVSLKDPESRIVLGTEHDKYGWHTMHNLQPQELTDMTSVILKLDDRKILYDKNDNVQKNDDKKSTSTQENEVIVYSDGGSRGNPGPSAAGFVILNQAQELIFEGGKYLGITTNNQAEYQAVKLGLEKALELGARFVDFRMDSLLVVNQMSGVYKIKNRDLWPIYVSIKDLVKKFEEVSFRHVRREFNKEADALVNKVLDEHR